MGLAGPGAVAFGITAVFVVAALVGAIAAPAMFWLGRLRQDELAHPLS
jgi:hypothetical protein